MPGRRKRIPNIYNLEVPLAVAAHNVGAQYLLATFIKHLVFAREQCHAPFNELEKHVQVGCSNWCFQQQHLLAACIFSGLWTLGQTDRSSCNRASLSL